MGRSGEAKDLSSNQGDPWMRVTGDAPEGDAPRDAGEGERLHCAVGHDGISRWQEQSLWELQAGQALIFPCSIGSCAGNR